MIHPDLPQWLLHTSMHVAGRRAGFDPFAISPSRDIARTEKPVFLAHGTLDEVIPVDHFHRLRASARSDSLVWKEIPTAYHYNILAEGGDDLYQEMVEFCLGAVQK